MNINYIKYFVSIAAFTVILSSCRVTRPYEKPVVSTDSLYRAENPGDTATIAALPYNEVFTDPLLQNLIREALDSNLDLRVAYERLRQSESYYRHSGAAFQPALDGNAGINLSRFSEAQNPLNRSATQYQLGLSSSWEVDIWGKLKSSRRAALANFLQTDAAERALKTGIVANVATYYFQLMALDRQLTITRETVENWKLTVETMKALKEASRVTEAAVVQSEAQRYAAEVTIPDLKQNIREIENALSVLLGKHPDTIFRGKIEDHQVVTLMQTGVPAQLLSYRPDVQEAEYNFRYNFEMTNVARTYFYPSLTITGTAGLSALSLDNLFTGGAFAGGIGGGLLQPVLNRRSNRTRLEVAESAQRAALYQFKTTLLNAGEEVSNAISLYHAATEKISIRANQLDALQKSVEYTQELLQNSFATYTEVITARQSLLQAELGKVNDRLQQLQSEVNLYRSLGGGWQ